jgi:hypothetical protein
MDGVRPLYYECPICYHDRVYVRKQARWNIRENEHVAWPCEGCGRHTTWVSVR